MIVVKLCWSSNSLFFNLKLSIFFDSIFEQWRISIIISFIIYSIFYFRFKRICYFSLIPFYPCFVIHSMIQLLFTRYIDSTRVKNCAKYTATGMFIFMNVIPNSSLIVVVEILQFFFFYFLDMALIYFSTNNDSLILRSQREVKLKLIEIIYVRFINFCI